MVPVRVRHVTIYNPGLQNTIAFLKINQILRKRYFKKAYLVRSKLDYLLIIKVLENFKYFIFNLKYDGLAAMSLIKQLTALYTKRITWREEEKRR